MSDNRLPNVSMAIPSLLSIFPMCQRWLKLDSDTNEFKIKIKIYLALNKNGDDLTNRKTKHPFVRLSILNKEMHTLLSILHFALFIYNYLLL